MQNINVTVKGTIATITVDLSERGGKSASGKNVIIASTGGNQSVPNFPDVKFGLNVYTKA